MAERLQRRYAFILPFPNTKCDSLLAKELVIRMLGRNPKYRISIKEVFEHEWMQEHGSEHGPSIAQEQLTTNQELFPNSTFTDLGLIIHLGQLKEEE